jgi:hypothetical protein
VHPNHQPVASQTQPLTSQTHVDHLQMCFYRGFTVHPNHQPVASQTQPLTSQAHLDNL